MRILAALALTGASLGLMGAAPPAMSSSTTLFGANPSAVVCSKHAIEQAAGAMSMVEAVAPCTVAIDTEPLDRHQLAATYVNRGVIWMSAKMMREAKADFEAAIRTDPRVGEGYVNRGATLVAMKQYAEGIADIDRGLALGAEEPQRAWYNKGLAQEAMGDLKGAYASYMKAAELSPDWAAPKAELARFSVSGR